MSSTTDGLPIISIVVATEVDALCASIILLNLLKDDGVSTRVYPCHSQASLNKVIDELGQAMDKGGREDATVRLPLNFD